MSFSDVFETGLDLGSLWDSVNQLASLMEGANPGANEFNPETLEALNSFLGSIGTISALLPPNANTLPIAVSTNLTAFFTGLDLAAYYAANGDVNGAVGSLISTIGSVVNLVALAGW